MWGTLSPLAGQEFKSPCVPSNYFTASGKKTSVFPLSCSWYETLTCFATFSENKKDFPSSILQHLGTINLGSHIFWVNVSNNLYSFLLLLFICNMWDMLPQGAKPECKMVIPVCVISFQNVLLSGQPDGSRTEVHFFLLCHFQHLSPPHSLSFKHYPGSCITSVQNSDTNQWIT